MSMLFFLCLAILQGNALNELVAAERAFAARAEKTTTQDAFLSVLADDATMFRPQAVNARESLRQQPMNPNGLLRWFPRLGDVAESGELGWTTGPSEAGQRGQAPTYKGHFVSIWQRSAAGEWRLQVDLGSAAPNPLPLSTLDTAFRRAPRPARAGRGTAAELSAADRKFATGISAYETLLSDSARVYRDGHQPTSTRASGIELLRSKPQPVKWLPGRAVVARSGDLGYTLGTYEGAENGNYVRLWRATSDRGWVIVLDITTAIPKQP